MILFSILSGLLFPLVVQAQGCDSLPYRFLDVSPCSTYGEALEYLKGAQVISRYGDGTFRPQAKVNRAEFVKIVTIATLGNDALAPCNGDVSFSDVPREAWYRPYVCHATSSRIIEGYPDGTFKPERTISFVEAAAVIARSAVIRKQWDKPAATEPWYTAYVESLASANAIPTTFTFLDQQVTRGEMAEMTYRILADRTDKPSRASTEVLAKQQGSPLFVFHAVNEGDRVGEMTVTKVEPWPMPDRFKVTFSGQIRVRGRYTDLRLDFGMNPEGVCFSDVDADSLRVLPQALDHTNTFCVGSTGGDLRAFTKGSTGEAEVTISRLTRSNVGAEAWDEAALASVHSVLKDPETEAECDARGGVWDGQAERTRRVTYEGTTQFIWGVCTF
ncbi:MAG: S-layer homology domain-containing protein, partial [Patescibacteria group bacterium]